MNKTKEKLKQIYDGWKHLAFKDPNVEKIAKARLEKCFGCDFCDETTLICKKCKCFTPSKARCIDCKCPENYWPC